jgi:putative transposase
MDAICTGRTSLATTGGTLPRHRAHLARLYPAPAQLQKLDRQGHTARALWNLLHEWHGWGGRGGSIAKRPSPREMDRQLRDARSCPLPGWEWLAELPAQSSQQVLRHYLRAWDRFFKGLSGPPRFKLGPLAWRLTFPRRPTFASSA